MIRERVFLRALPYRMLNTDVNYGMTVCSVGSYLDLFWQGESTAIFKQGRDLFLADVSESCDAPDTIWFKIPM